MKTLTSSHEAWHELSDKQLCYVYQLIASKHTADEIKSLFLD